MENVKSVLRKSNVPEIRSINREILNDGKILITNQKQGGVHLVNQKDQF
jgi:hypothetical protein